MQKLRRDIPNLVLRTTFIVGFPGETDEQFQELKDFVQETRFERMGVFPYSPEPGTPAMKLDGHLPDEVKQARYEELMAVQQEAAFAFGDSLLGYELDCIVDDQVDSDTWIGRIYTDAPEIDANVYIQGDGLEIGSLVPVELVARQDYDWVAQAAADEDE